MQNINGSPCTCYRRELVFIMLNAEKENAITEFDLDFCFSCCCEVFVVDPFPENLNFWALKNFSCAPETLTYWSFKLCIRQSMEEMVGLHLGLGAFKDKYWVRAF